MKEVIKKVTARHNLTREEAALAMDMIMQGQATPSQIAALLTALHMKGESIDEITGFAEKMREHATHVFPNTPNLVDTCGTGGDHAGTFNISTIAAIVASAAGVPIAKHGNRSVSSRCGSADVLEALGVRVDLDPEKVKDCIDKVGFGFIFAPNFHKAMRFAMPTRREIGIRTVFNILGPLTNPANAKAQVLGVFSEGLTEVMAQVLKNLGTQHALVVHGLDGLDEISLNETTRLSELKDAKISTYSIQPEDFGFTRSRTEELAGGSAAENAEIALQILNGNEKGTKRNIVLLNAGAAIYVGGRAKNIQEGIFLAQETINNGKAKQKLEQVIHFIG